jgi:ABC-type Mn2+/Zn2+ transport system permease subunit
MMTDWLVAPWLTAPWFVRALVAGVTLALTASLVGVHLYLRRMSMVSDALAHASLPGVLLGWLLAGAVNAWALLAGALVSSTLTMGLIYGVSRLRYVKPDAAIGVVFPVLFALGIIGISTVGRRADLDLDCVLFGNMLGVADHSLVLTTALFPVAILVLVALHRPLVTGAFDPTFAALAGQRLRLASVALVLLTSCVAVACLETVGAVMTIGLLVTPAATAHNLATSVPGMYAWALASSVASVVAGLVLAVLLNLSPAGVVVMCLGACYLLSLVLRQYRSGRRPILAS